MCTSIQGVFVVTVYVRLVILLPVNATEKKKTKMLGYFNIILLHKSAIAKTRPTTRSVKSD